MKLKLFKRDSNSSKKSIKNDDLLFNTSNSVMVDKNPNEIHDKTASSQQEFFNNRKDENEVDLYSKLDDIGVGGCHSRSGTSKSAATGLDEESFGSAGDSGRVERADFVDKTMDSSDQAAVMPNPFSSKVFLPLTIHHLLPCIY